MYKTIELTQSKFTLVDYEDYEYLSQFKWQFNKGYARRSWRKNNKIFNMSMHRAIMNPSEKEQIDHINGDKLDNRKENLRICTSTGNNRNVNSHKGISGYKGVHWYKKVGKWAAFITINYKHKYLGSFNEKADAALAYNKAAKKYFGEFAKLNEL